MTERVVQPVSEMFICDRCGQTDQAGFRWLAEGVTLCVECAVVAGTYIARPLAMQKSEVRAGDETTNEDGETG